jgi:aspartate/methionine/tyrosine aminotransferase
LPASLKAHDKYSKSLFMACVNKIDLPPESQSVFIGKQGNGIISFGSGQPDLSPPREAAEELDIRRDLRYGLIQGEAPLREALAAEYPTSSTAADFITTNGVSGWARRRWSEADG